MATKKKKRYTAKVEFDSEMKDWVFLIIDNRNGGEVVKKTGYKSKASAWRGFTRRVKTLFQVQNILIQK